MRPSLLPNALLGLLIDWAITHGVYASSDAAFLKDNTLVREGQVQNVLEHEPAQTASCEHIVSTLPLCVWGVREVKWVDVDAGADEWWFGSQQVR